MFSVSVLRTVFRKRSTAEKQLLSCSFSVEPNDSGLVEDSAIEVVELRFTVSKRLHRVGDPHAPVEAQCKCDVAGDGNQKPL